MAVASCAIVVDLKPRTPEERTSPKPPPLGPTGRRGSGSNLWPRKTVFCRLPSIREGASRTGPACGEDDRRHREGKVFRLIACDHKGDAAFIGARNILTKTLAALGHVLFPGLEMSAIQRDVSGQTVSHLQVEAATVAVQANRGCLHAAVAGPMKCPASHWGAAMHSSMTMNDGGPRGEEYASYSKGVREGS